MNKRTEQTRWTPKRLLSLLMALIMTLSLLPTAAFAAFGNGETNTIDASTVALAPTRNHVADGTIEGTNTKVSLLFSIDSKEVSKPGERVNVTAYADLEEGSGDDVKMTKVSLTDNKTTYGDKSWAQTKESSILGYPKVGDDGSADFTISVEYVVNGTTTGSKSVRVVIKNLWTGYNITFESKPAGAVFTGGIPESGKAKTHARNAAAGDFTPVYTIPATADAILDGYTFEGWTSEEFRGYSGYGYKINLAPGEYTYDFGSDATFYAMLYKNQEITFDAGDYDGVTGILNKTQYSRGTKYDITVQDPKLDGYQFAGWLFELNGTPYIYKRGDTVHGITSATTLIAQWTPDDGSAPVGSHKVTFFENAAGVYNMPAPQTVKDSDKATLPTVKPQRDGYTFGGWYTNAACTGAAFDFTTDTVTTDLELYAKWVAEMVKVTFPAADHLPAGVTYDPHSSAPVTGMVAKGSNVTFRLKLAESYDPATLHVYAHGVELLGTPFGNDPSSSLYEYTAQNVMTDTIIFVYPLVSVKTFNVTLPTGAGFDAAFVVPAGTVPAGAADNKLTTVNYDGTVSFTVKARPGYTVEGVYANGVKLDPDTSTTDTYTIKNIKSNQAVMVDMAAVQFHTVTYVLDGAQMATQSVQDNVTLTPLSAPNKTGYTWNNTWYTDKTYNTKFDFTTEKITKDTVLYGRYTPDKVTISYDVLPGETTAKTYGLAATLTETIPVKDGHTFLGWSESDTATAASYLPGATFSKEIDHNITLYAVWQKNTYTITFSSGAGYSLHSGHGSMTVEHGGSFEFNLIVDRAYAENEPKVWKNTDGVNSGEPLGNGTPTTNQDGSKKYHYTLTNVTENIAINVDVRSNTIYTVTFMTNGNIYQTQQVGYNEKATRPVDPVVEGYKFEGWYKDEACTTAWNFVDVPATAGTTAILADTVTGPTTLYAKLTPITPTITWPTTAEQVGYTIEVKGTKSGETAESTLASGDKVAYGSTVTFTITISTGYDASKMQVGINGVLLSPKSIVDDVYTYEFTAKENTKITVVGVERKTVTIIYNANARDDVSGMPEAQTVKYYLDTTPADNDTIVNQIPVRTGYKFLGWNKDSKAEAADSDYTVDKIKAGTTAKFTENTTLYAVWEADALTAELIITDEFTSAPSGTTISGSKLEYAYEGDSITLVGKLSADAQGTMTFYKKAKTATDWTFLGTTSINGGNYGVLGTTVENYKWGNADETATKSNYRWEYKVKFKPTTDEGYSPCEASDDLRVYSKAISWEVDKKADTTTYNWTNAKNTLTIYTNEARTTTTDKMTANSTYWLQIPAVYELDGGLNLKNNNITKLSVGTHYEITWEYEDSANHWTTYATTSDTDWVKVTPEYSGYSFRAKVTPTQSSIYTKAATYDENGTVVKDVYWDYLITKATAKTEKQDTATALEITGADDENSVTIAGTSVTTGLAQFEGQKVTLTATVKDTTTGTPAVTTGYVNFYRKGATADTLLNASPIAVGANGVATCEVEISKWTDGKSVTENKDEFYAVYLANATYDTSASWTAAAGKLEAVYIKSTTIKTPIIESTLANDAGDKATTYIKDLTGLLAGVQHEFKLRTGNAEPDWSVVALDGRTVAAKNYDIEWQYKQNKTNDNFAKAGNDSTAEIYTTKTTEVGDQYRVVLKAKGDMKTDATSKVAEIGKKQNVTVTVEASDEINSTAETDVYQLNEITLTATVAAKETSSTMKPTGTVKFYYKDRQVTPATFVYLGEATLEKGTDGKMHASIKTDKLPVDKDKNTKLDVVVCAAYFGDDTFAASKNVSATTGNIASAGSPSYVTYDTVTVYSSVVFAGDSENKATAQSNYGITITANGALKANESSVTLTLGQVYTLDHPIDLSKLTYNTDYTVQWQILKNALQHQDSSAGSYATTDKWEDLPNQTGSSYTGTMEQDAAYRAKITVKDTPIAKGSFDEVTQANPGRKVYYSNVLVVGAGMATVTTNITTSANQKFNEEGIVSGETATIHVLASGAAKTTPISTVTATITKSGAPDPVFNEKANNVNGYTSFAWDTANLTPGYYTLTVTAESNNGYAPQTITRTLIVRDNAYTLTATKESKVYNGKAQGIDWTLTGVDIENALAQKSVVVYYTKDGKMVEPTQAGEYQYDLYLPASAYWTELTHITGTFIIEKRPVEVVDLVAQAKVYDGTNNANIQEIILNDSAVDSKGTATGNTGIIDGDSVYAVGTGYTSKDTAGTDATLGVKDVSLKGDDAANYVLVNSGHTEEFNIQRSQVKGAIVSGRTYKYTGKDIKLAASDIYLIDQAGNQLTKYDVTYYYHNGDGVEKVSAMNKMGKYTVIACPEQNNYKGGATETVYVGNTDTPGTLNNGAKSSLITISNTVELYGATENKGIVATATNNATVTVEYHVGTGWSARPTDAGRYLVKVTATNGSVTDTAYGLYTVVKARPALTLTATGATYNSAQYNGAPTGNYNDGALPADTYYTYTGGTIQGVAYEAPTEAGDYVVTAHVGKAANYTAHEISANFTIDKAPLTIKADDLQRWQYGSFPDMVASYQGLATGGVAADTSLRDVQIQPEFLFNEQNGGYTNHAFDQVGTYPVTVRNALARNYTVTYVGGTIATTKEEPKAELAIHGMPDNGTTTENLVYYGDTIQLYAYGYYKTLDSSRGSYNTSSLIEWAVSSGAPASIDPNGLLKIKGVGTFTVTLTRGSGSAAISTDINVEAKKQEVKVVVPAEDKVYDGTTQDYTSTKTLSAVNAMGTDVFVGNGNFVIANNTRSDVGSQIVTGKVSDSIHSFQSETYGGLFTINVKNVSVTPNEISVIYGEALGTLGTPGTPGTLGYSENDTVVGVAALTDGKAVSERDAYINLDVLNGYEILVAGRENENYNVKYVTDQDAPDVEVTAKDLSISTGTLNSDGRTSGYLKDNDQFYMNEGFAITGTTFNLTPNDRMYGEVNPVMDYTFAGFVSGDSEADLVTLLPWLVKYSDGTYHNINGNANVAFDKTNHLNGFRATSFMSGMSAYPIDSMLLANSVKNYTLASTEATQNIYQRPVTLKLREGLTKLTAYKPEILGSSGSVTTEGKAKLLELLLNNLVVDKYNGEGGLAELLKHTIEDLNIQIDTISVSADKLTLTLKLGNQNYWLDSASSTIEIELVSTKIVPVYSPLDWTSFTVTMYNETKTSPVAISGNVRFFIFQEKDGVELKYSNYKNDTIIRSDLMESTGRTGEFRATFSRLPAGDYAIFAIAENYTIVE